MSRKRYLAVIVVGVLAFAGAGLHTFCPADSKEGPGKGPTIQLNRKTEGDKATTFTVVGLGKADLANLAKVKWEPEQWTALFALYVDNGKLDKGPKPPAMLGSHRVEKDVLLFEPRFSLTPGVSYQAVFDPSRLPGRTNEKSEPVVTSFAVPKPAQKATTVVQQVFPTRNKLPENQLKFYLHFSAPMKQGDSYTHIHLLNAASKEIEDAFLELGEELWDAQSLRFTLFIDPGRIKRGLKPREDLGPVFEDGKEYTLVLDRAWEDAQGNPLKESYRKAFKVVGPEEAVLDPKTWKLAAPKAGKAEALTVAFPKPLDHALLHRLLWVIDAKGQKVAGSIQVTDEETHWRFTPERPWTAGAYELVADAVLEDLAGNSIGRAFEVDVFRPIERTVETKTVKLPFQIGPADRPK